jgi:hypothetical protein
VSALIGRRDPVAWSRLLVRAKSLSLTTNHLVTETLAAPRFPACPGLLRLWLSRLASLFQLDALGKNPPLFCITEDLAWSAGNGLSGCVSRIGLRARQVAVAEINARRRICPKSRQPGQSRCGGCAKMREPAPGTEPDRQASIGWRGFYYPSTSNVNFSIFRGQLATKGITQPGLCGLFVPQICSHLHRRRHRVMARSAGDDIERSASVGAREPWGTSSLGTQTWRFRYAL